MPKSTIQFNVSTDKKEFDEICSKKLSSMPKCVLIKTDEGFILREENIDFVKGTWPATSRISFSNGSVKIDSTCGGMGPFQKKHVEEFGNHIKDMIESNAFESQSDQEMLNDTVCLDKDSSVVNEEEKENENRKPAVSKEVNSYMEEYHRLYPVYVEKSNDVLKEVINPKNGYSKVSVEVARDILVYERKVKGIESEKYTYSKRTIPEKKKELLKKIAIVILLIFAYPIGMYFLWKDRKIDRQFKVIESTCGLVAWISFIIVFSAGNFNHTNQTETFYQVDSRSEREFPYNFTVATEKQMAQLQETEGLKSALSESLEKISAAGETQFTFGNFKNENSIITLDAYGVTPQSKKILVSFRYEYSIYKSGWTLVSVKDADTGHYYYVMDELKNTVDLYNYTTGTLVFHKPKEIRNEASNKNKSNQTTSSKPSKSTEKKETNIQQETNKAEVKQEPIVEESEMQEETETQEETPRREGMYGISDKSIYDLESSFHQNKVRNDVTGNWRISTVAENMQMVEYALSYYNSCIRDNEEVHGIVNFNNSTTTCITANGMDDRIFVTVHEYVDGEEHDANYLFSGLVLEDYIVYIDNGDIEKIQ